VATRADAELPALAIRGVQVDETTFRFPELTSDEVARSIADYQQSVFWRCMNGRGFHKEPDDSGDSEYNLAFEAEAIGLVDDPSNIRPRTYVLPDNSRFTVTSSVVPGTCWWEAWSSLGTEPIYRQAFSFRMTELVNEAETLAANDDGISVSEAHYRVAQRNAALVNAWVALHDDEYARLPQAFKSATTD